MRDTHSNSTPEAIRKPPASANWPSKPVRARPGGTVSGIDDVVVGAPVPVPMPVPVPVPVPVAAAFVVDVDPPPPAMVVVAPAAVVVVAAAAQLWAVMVLV